MKLKLGTRGSNLARTQSATIARELEAAGHEIEFVIIRTAGDDSTAPFGAIGPQGVFVREIEQALLDGRVDLAVHSFKDLPTASPDGLVIAAVPPRRDVADLLVAQADALDLSRKALLPLKRAARVGTASARRRVWLEHFRADLDVHSLRGNVPTRLERLEEGRFDAILLAAAGVGRLREAGDVLEAALGGLVVTRLDPEQFVPAPAQGALAVQCRRDDEALRAALAVLDDAPTRLAVETERAALALAEGGCETAFGAYARPTEAGTALIAMLERGGAIVTARAESRDASTLPARVFDAFDEAKGYA